MTNNLFNQFKWKQDGRPFGWGASPDTDWKMIFLTTLALLLVVSAGNLFVFMQVRDGAFVDETASEGELPTLNIENLKAAASYYETKAAEFDKIRNGAVAPVSDPSI